MLGQPVEVVPELLELGVGHPDSGARPRAALALGPTLDTGWGSPGVPKNCLLPATGRRPCSSDPVPSVGGDIDSSHCSAQPRLRSLCGGGFARSVRLARAANFTPFSTRSKLLPSLRFIDSRSFEYLRLPYSCLPILTFYHYAIVWVF